MRIVAEPLVIEGGLLSYDLVERIDQQEGQRSVKDLREPIRGLERRQPRDRRTQRMLQRLEDIPDRTSIVDYAAHLWRLARERYAEFRTLSPKDRATTRDYWVVPLLRLLDYDPTRQPRAIRLDGRTYDISHRADPLQDSPPVHIVGWEEELGERPVSGRGSRSPHSLVQEYLNDSEDVWGVVTNGRLLRILRSSGYFTRPTYIQFDLEVIFEHELFDAFILLVRLAHRSRLPLPGQRPADCLLEKYFTESREEGSRARDRLRDSVKDALEILANGFIEHPRNSALRQKLADGTYDADRFYRELLYLVYRLLFLFCAEERGLLSLVDPSQNGRVTRLWRVYRENLSVARLRRLAESLELEGQQHHDDLWLGLRTLFAVLATADLARAFLLSPLDGELFQGNLLLDKCHLSNAVLLRAIRHLSQFEPEEERVPRRINYARMDVEELGSVYESLLDYRPVVELDTHPPFQLAPGTERKSTGSYYTPDELVRELIRTALEPVLEERLREAGWRDGAGDAQAAREAILSIRVVDPACGSGHFLLAAARRLGQELARVDTGQREPDAEQVRRATREVIRRCIYGVDRNPLAVDLCRVGLWIEGHCRGMPLTFLDHHIKCGDSLVGVFDLEVLKQGIPDKAFNPVTGDDRKLAQQLKKRNRQERKQLIEKGQRLLGFDLTEAAEELTRQVHAVEQTPDDSPDEVRRKRELYQDLMRSEEAERLRVACDLWTAAFFQRRDEQTPRDALITTEVLVAYLSGQNQRQAVEAARELSRRFRFFHWPLEFPTVFERGGFDVVLGNPPWERIKLQEQEFFATRDEQIASAANRAERHRLIQDLPERDPLLWEEYQQALHASESTSRFLRTSGAYPLTGRGDINTYSVFAERMRNLLAPGGHAGVIVPTGIATDDTNKHFFADLAGKGELVSLVDFENRQGIFPEVHRSYRFCLLTMGRSAHGTAPGQPSFRLAFFCTRVEHTRDASRTFTLSPMDVSLINPNTGTMPLFRTRQDAELTRVIYERLPVLMDEANGTNPWMVSFLRMFDMANDSHLFRTAAQLERAGYRRVGNRYVRGSKLYLPLYEAKMIWHYDHRFGTYEGLSARRNAQLPNPTQADHADPAFLVQPWYWVDAEEVEQRLGDWRRRWLMCWRDIARCTDERTAIFGAIPLSGVGDTCLLALAPTPSSTCLLFAGNWSAIVHDYVVRQKVSGTHLKFFTAKQFPVLPLEGYAAEDTTFIVPHALELTYTAWDMKPFADDVWRDADADLQQAIRKQWEENKAETGGHRWELPDWIDAYPEIETDRSKGIPLPPFKWSEERRARLQAELDAYYALLYGLTRKQLRYILDPADLTEAELKDILDPDEEVQDPLDEEGYRERRETSRFPGETFRVLRDKELKRYGEYRTRRLVLEAYERLKPRFAGRRTEYRDLVQPAPQPDPTPSSPRKRRRRRKAEGTTGTLPFGAADEDQPEHSAKRPRASPERTSDDAQVDPEQLLPVIRSVLMEWTRDTQWTRDELTDAVLQKAGLPSSAREAVRRAIQLAVRRRLLVRNGSSYEAWCLSIDDYDNYQRDALAQAVYRAAAAGNHGHEELLKAAAAWLGFRRVGQKMARILDETIERLIPLWCIAPRRNGYVAMRGVPPLPYTEGELMVAVRQVATSATPQGEATTTALRIMLAEALRVCNFTAAQAKVLDRTIRTAAERKIISVDEDERVFLCTKSIFDYRYHYDWLVDFVVECAGPYWKHQDDVIKQVAHKLGFDRVDEDVEWTIKGAIRAALRRELLERDGRWLRQLEP